jgi:endoglucanase
VGDPLKSADMAEEFFTSLSSKFSKMKHIFYEICNEPNGQNVTWKDNVKPYAERIIPIIRKNDPDSIIIVGSPNWSQDIHIAAADPLAFDNLMYAFHIYAGSHGDDLYRRAEETSKKLALFLTEFGFTESDGGLNMKLYLEQTKKWMEMMDRNGLSWCNWGLYESKEGCAVLDWKVKGDGTLTSRLSESGKLLLTYLKK